MIKVADLNISADNCGPYVIKLTGADAIYFKAMNKELYFLLEKPYICKTSYAVTVSITDLANRFTPKTAVYNLSTPYCSCTTSTSTTASPAMVNFANFNNAATWGGLTGNVTSSGTNGGPSAYGTYDQTGNVFEWHNATNVGSSSLRGYRGGSYNSNASSMDSAFRDNALAVADGSSVGFRIASFLNPSVLSNFVAIGNRFNDVDLRTGNLFGNVNYDYLIGKYLVNNYDYNLFLNATAKSDPYGTYNVNMKITRSGNSGSYAYLVQDNYANKPVVFVSWFDCARYCNWLHNGAGSVNTTETGAYLLNGVTTGNAPAQSSSARYHIPSENEWYKAAYYSPNYGGAGVGGYWRYATQSNLLPTPVCATSIGDGTVCSNITTTPTPTTSTTASPFGLNFASVDNGAIIPSINGSITNDEYIGPLAYNYSLGCNTYSWPANGALCTGNNPNTIARSLKLASDGSTWFNFNTARTAIDPAHLVIDLGTIRTFNMARYYQMFSDGKATHVALDISSNGSLQGRTSAGWTEVHAFNQLDNSPTSNGIGVVLPTTTARYLRLRLYNDGRYGDTNWVELYNFKLFFVTLAAALTPTFGSVLPTPTGFTMQITNYDPAYTWAGTTQFASIVISGAGFVTVTGVSGFVGFTATITTTRAGWNIGSATINVVIQSPTTTTITTTPTPTTTTITTTPTPTTTTITTTPTPTTSTTIAPSGTTSTTIAPSGTTSTTIAPSGTTTTTSTTLPPFGFGNNYANYHAMSSWGSGS